MSKRLTHKDRAVNLYKLLKHIFPQHAHKLNVHQVTPEVKRDLHFTSHSPKFVVVHKVCEVSQIRSRYPEQLQQHLDDSKLIVEEYRRTLFLHKLVGQVRDIEMNVSKDNSSIIMVLGIDSLTYNHDKLVDELMTPKQR